MMHYKDDQGEYLGKPRYYEYRDLQMFKRTYPKRCAEYIQKVIPCEYYTVRYTKKPRKDTLGINTNTM